MPDFETRPVRARMIDGATQILARRGLRGTAFSEVIALAGASRGSIYHHFPGGKAELIDAVLTQYTDALDQQVRSLIGRPAVAFCDAVLGLWRATLLRYDCEAGSPVTAATVAADSTRVQERCRLSYRALADTLRAGLERGGLRPGDAGPAAAFLLAALEGAQVLCRACGDIGPFDAVADQVRARVAQLAAGGG